MLLTHSFSLNLTGNSVDGVKSRVILSAKWVELWVDGVMLEHGKWVPQAEPLSVYFKSVSCDRQWEKHTLAADAANNSIYLTELKWGLRAVMFVSFLGKLLTDRKTVQVFAELVNNWEPLCVPQSLLSCRKAESNPSLDAYVTMYWDHLSFFPYFFKNNLNKTIFILYTNLSSPSVPSSHYPHPPPHCLLRKG